RTISSWIEPSSPARHQFEAFLSAAPAEVSTRIAQKLRAHERIGTGAQHTGTRLAACGPTHHVGPRGSPVQDAQAGRRTHTRATPARGRLRALRASAGEARIMPRPKTEITKPTERDVVLILAKRMGSSIDSRPAPTTL